MTIITELREFFLYSGKGFDSLLCREILTGGVQKDSLIANIKFLQMCSINKIFEHENEIENTIVSNCESFKQRQAEDYQGKIQKVNIIPIQRKYFDICSVQVLENMIDCKVLAKTCVFQIQFFNGSLI